MFPPGFTCPAVLWIQLATFGFRLRDYHPLWCAFPHTSTNFLSARCCPNPGSISTPGLASSAFARHYLRNLVWFLFLALLRCFSSGGSPRIPIWFSIRWLISHQPGCPIRKSADIMPAYGSPQLIAVNHVLLRLPVPRHSPCALCSLTFFLSRISLCLPYVVLCGVRLRYAFALQLSYAILFLRLQVFTRW